MLQGPGQPWGPWLGPQGCPEGCTAALGGGGGGHPWGCPRGATHAAVATRHRPEGLLCASARAPCAVGGRLCRRQGAEGRATLTRRAHSAPSSSGSSRALWPCCACASMRARSCVIEWTACSRTAGERSLASSASCGPTCVRVSGGVRSVRQVSVGLPGRCQAGVGVSGRCLCVRPVPGRCQSVVRSGLGARLASRGPPRVARRPHTAAAPRAPPSRGSERASAGARA